LSLAEKQRVCQYPRKQMNKGTEDPDDTTGESGVPINNVPALQLIMPAKPTKRALVEVEDKENDPPINDQPIKRRRPQHCCMFAGQCMASIEKGASKAAPTEPVYPSFFVDKMGNLLSDEVINRKLEFYGRQKFHYAEVQHRAGMASSCLVSLRICQRHDWTKIRKSFSYDYVENAKVTGSRTTTNYFQVPSDAGLKMAGYGLYSNGLGVERFQASVLGNLQNEDGSSGSNPWLCLQQASELFSEAERMEKEGLKDGKKGGLRNSPILLRASGLDVHPEFTDTPGYASSNNSSPTSSTDQSTKQNKKASTLFGCIITIRHTTTI
jgi:hypothetical protein